MLVAASKTARPPPPSLGQHHQESHHDGKPPLRRAGCGRSPASLAVAGMLALARLRRRQRRAEQSVRAEPGAPAPLSSCPPTSTVYSGVPTTLTITGGVAALPRVLVSNPAILPVAAERRRQRPSCSSRTTSRRDTAVTITVAGRRGPRRPPPATVTVSRRRCCSISLTITPNGDCADCGTSLCSGQTGTATVVVHRARRRRHRRARQVRFDVVFGTVCDRDDQSGAAARVDADRRHRRRTATRRSVIQANVNAPTQIAQIRATDVTSGKQVTGNFRHPAGHRRQRRSCRSSRRTATITGAVQRRVLDRRLASTTTSSAARRRTGRRRRSRAAVTLVGNSGRRRNGGVFDGDHQRRVRRSAARSRSSTRRAAQSDGARRSTNDAGHGGPRRGDAAGAGRHARRSYVRADVCTGKTFPFVVAGGTPPYSVSRDVRPRRRRSSRRSRSPTSRGTSSVSSLLDGSRRTRSIIVVDSSTPQKTVTATITCN